MLCSASELRFRITPSISASTTNATSTSISVNPRCPLRITSYNVCYTKLLRHFVEITLIDQRRAVHLQQLFQRRDQCIGHAGKTRDIQEHAGSFECPLRITSYNVCYTKLLRYCKMLPSIVKRTGIKNASRRSCKMYCKNCK